MSIAPSMSQVRTRIAPSPTGLPHLGLIFQAIINYMVAKQNQGKFILRLDDTDRTRYNPQAEQAILDTLRWIQLEPDEGSHNPGSLGPYRQSERLPSYQKIADLLVHQGHAYRCFCSTERLTQLKLEQQKNNQLPKYDRHCLQLSELQSSKLAKSTPYVIRLKVPQSTTIVCDDLIRGQISFQSELIDDQVLLKSDGFPTYHLATVVDDHNMGITHVIRGEEWLSSFPKHVLLFSMLNWQLPTFIHTPTLRNPDKSKLSKRHGHSNAQWYQDNGYLPQAVINFILNTVWTHPDELEIFSISDILNIFDIKKLHITGPIVDINKLKWLNGQYIRSLEINDLVNAIKPFVPDDCPTNLLPSILTLIKDRITTLSDFENLSSYFYRELETNIFKKDQLLKKSSVQQVNEQLSKTLDHLSSLTQWDFNSIEQTIRELQEKNDWHKGQYFMLLRYCVTGQTATPPLFETISTIGLPTIKKRIETVIDYLLK